MKICYYDITLKNEDTNGSVSFWADSFSVDENRILRIQSKDCGDITTKVEDYERLIVKDVVVENEYDEICL